MELPCAPARPRHTARRSACGTNGKTDNTQNANEGLTADQIVSKGITAIPTLQGDPWNMAADVDMNFGNLTESNDVSAKREIARGRVRKADSQGNALPAETPADTTANTE